LLLILEDLHWIDSETQALLDGLVESLPTARILLLVNYRPEYEHAWSRKTYYLQLRIDPLLPEGADALLTALLGDDATLEPLKPPLIARTEGNPFFLEESVRTLVETGVLVGERGAYRMPKAPVALQIPATAQAILAARIDRLSPEEKRLLQAAAVIGKDVPLPLLQAITDVPDEALRQGLSRLQAAEFLYERSLFPDLEYTFKHALTHEVAYGSMLQDRRRPLHGRIVEAIEARYPGRLAEQAEELAHHAFRGAVWDKAVTYLHQAGAKTFARSANREAVRYFEQALLALAHISETRETLERAIDLRFDLRTALFALGEFERIVGYLREAGELARRLDDQRRLGQMAVFMSHNLWVTGRPNEALRFGRDASAIADRLADFPLRVGARIYVGAAHFAAGEYREGEEPLREVLGALEAPQGRERLGLAGFPAAMVRFYLALILADRGEFDDGIHHGREGIRVAEELEHPYSVAAVCWALANLYGIRGEFGEAVRLLDRGRALARDWNLTFWLAIATGALGHVYTMSGRVDEGFPLLEEARQRLESMGMTQFTSLVVGHLGEANLVAGRFEEAAAQATRVMALARERGQRGHEGWMLRLLGEIALRGAPPDIDAAAARYREALALARERGMRPLVAHCHLGLGRVCRRASDSTGAREQFTRAGTMYREMGMAYWLRQAEAELGSPEPPVRSSLEARTGAP
jgi:tetratricopeptide (TPR) repeat protein